MLSFFSRLSLIPFAFIVSLDFTACRYVALILSQQWNPTSGALSCYHHDHDHHSKRTKKNLWKYHAKASLSSNPQSIKYCMLYRTIIKVMSRYTENNMLSYYKCTKYHHPHIIIFNVYIKHREWIKKEDMTCMREKAKSKSKHNIILKTLKHQLQTKPANPKGKYKEQ